MTPAARSGSSTWFGIIVRIRPGSTATSPRTSAESSCSASTPAVVNLSASLAGSSIADLAAPRRARISIIETVGTTFWSQKEERVLDMQPCSPERGKSKGHTNAIRPDMSSPVHPARARCFALGTQAWSIRPTAAGFWPTCAADLSRVADAAFWGERPGFKPFIGAMTAGLAWRMGTTGPAWS